jgi:hypothetical protein
MASFGSLLHQLTKNLQSQSPSKTLSSRSRSRSNSPKNNRKRARQVDAKDFPPVKHIVLICPAGVQTGGPEALHQLCDKINTIINTNENDNENNNAVISISASMVYCQSNGRSISVVPRAERLGVYDRYHAPTERRNPFLNPTPISTLLIWPECWTNEMIHYLETTTTPSPCAIWWLSVNNNTGRFQDWNRTDIVHLYQSEYARQHIVQHGAKYVYPMTEYIANPPILDNTKTRPMDVLYNPLKGIHYTDEILKRSGTAFQIVPIGKGLHGQQKISPEQVREMLLQTKIYIDFGPHPGMDRLPREAALAGCLVVTNVEGAAGNHLDIPLPEKYKRKDFHVDEIHSLLKDLLSNYDARSKELDNYRAWIHGQEDRMNECISQFLNIVVTSKQPTKM